MPTPSRSTLLVIATAFLAGAMPTAYMAQQPERILTHGNLTGAGVLTGNALHLRLETREGLWFPEAEDGPSIRIQAFGEVGKPLNVPGPLIRVREGTEIRIALTNRLSDSLVVYGLHTRPGSPDDAIRVAPGATVERRFRAGVPGTYFYWGSTTGKPMDDRGGVDSQLGGALIVDPAHVVADDRVFVMGAWFEEGKDGAPDREVMTINGKGWPHTERFSYSVGDTVRWRWVNPTWSSHPMHLHGFYFRLDSRGTWAADSVFTAEHRQLAVTELMLPGGTSSFVWVPEREGNWLFHCHFPFHMTTGVSLTPRIASASHRNGEHGTHDMAGLVLGLYVRPPVGAAPVEETNAPRHLRLLVQSAPRRYGEHAGLGYVLQDGGAEPKPDSIQVPGSTLVLTRGEPVAITVVNRLAEPTSVHWHGIELESFPDGVPGWSGTPGNILQAIAPADSFTAHFTPPRAGTFIYHTHVSEVDQMRAGLYGAIVVIEPGRIFDPARDHLIIAGQSGVGDDAPGVVNGSRTPPPLELRAGETHRLRFVNITTDWRVMFALVSDTSYAQWRPVAKDGADLSATLATGRPAHLLTGPGETADVEVHFPSPGTWRLEVKTQLAGWHVPVLIHVR